MRVAMPVVLVAGLVALHARLYRRGMDHMHFQVVDWVEENVRDDEWVGAESAAPLEHQVGTALAPLRYYTSGTTGRPKAVIRMQHAEQEPERAAAALRSAQAVFDQRLGVVADPGEVHLLAAVVYHTAPGGYSSMALTWGHTVVIMDRFDAEEALRLIEQHGVTWTQMAPIHLVRITALANDVKERYDLSSMKRLLHAGAPCPVDVKQQMMEWWGPVIDEYYAASEGYGLAGVRKRNGPVLSLSWLF